MKLSPFIGAVCVEGEIQGFTGKKALRSAVGVANPGVEAGAGGGVGVAVGVRAAVAVGGGAVGEGCKGGKVGVAGAPPLPTHPLSKAKVRSRKNRKRFFIARPFCLLAAITRTAGLVSLP